MRILIRANKESIRQKTVRWGNFIEIVVQFGRMALSSKEDR